MLIFLMFGPPKLLARSDTPDFCGSCHVMGPEYEAWLHMGAHRRKQCVDCHLPNQNAAAHYALKAVDGLKDVLFFYSGAVPERIRITGRGEKILQANCIRCHETVALTMDHDRKCWECHRRLIHTRNGLLETI